MGANVRTHQSHSLALPIRGGRTSATAACSPGSVHTQPTPTWSVGPADAPPACLPSPPPRPLAAAEPRALPVCLPARAASACASACDSAMLPTAKPSMLSSTAVK